MAVKQISVFMENRAGKISAVTRLLGNGGIDIRAMSLADTTDFGILRIVVNDTEKAMQILEENNFSATTTKVLAVGLDDKPGGLAAVMEALLKVTPLFMLATATLCIARAQARQLWAVLIIM